MFQPSLILICLLIFFQATAQKKVLLIGIDGCRPDALMSANAPNLKSLMAEGIFTLDAETDELTFSGPGWSSMLTGVNSAKHQVLSNKFENNNTAQYPHFFSYLPDEMKLVSIAHWFPINKHLAREYADKAIFRFDPGVANKCSNLLDGKKSPDVIFLHFDAVDHAGHASGFSPDNPEYIEAIERIDSYVGQIIEALDDRKATHPEEDWLVISSTDHGGRDTGHGGGKDDPARRNIFIVVQNDKLIPKQIQGGNVMDVTCTILDFLEVKIDKKITFDGVSLL